jgi:hypothetical protein
MNCLQYAFYAINIYLEKMIEDFRWGNTRARQSGNLAARAQIQCVGDTGSAKGGIIIVGGLSVKRCIQLPSVGALFFTRGKYLA